MNEYDIGSKFREFRLARSLTQSSVAREMGFSISLLSQIENNKISPPIGTLSRLARFFNVKLSELFVEKSDRRRFEIIRKEDRNQVFPFLSRVGYHLGYFCEPFFQRLPNKKMVPVLLTLSAECQESTISCHEDESFIFVLQGGLDVLCMDRKIVLAEGDSVYFYKSLQYSLRSTAGTEAVILVVTAD